MTRRTSLLALALLLPGALAVSEAQDDLTSPKLRIEWAEFKKLYDAKAIVVIDVRGSIAFEAGHIPGAQSVPLEQVESRAEELRKLGKPIVFYCA